MSTVSASVVTDTIKGAPVKALTVVNSGSLYASNENFNQSPTEFAYGTWEFWVKQTSTSDLYVNIVTDTGAGNGYFITFGVTDRQVRLRKKDGGAPGTILYTSTTGVYTLTDWFKFTMTRDAAGVFTLYINDIALPASGLVGTNPFTDKTYMTVNYIMHSFSAGSGATRFSLGGADGNYSFIKKIL